MKSLEIEGKTIDEAIEKACDVLRVSREKLGIEIITEGSSGFFGIGNKKAKIKATMLSFNESFSDSNFTPSIPSPSPNIVTETSATKSDNTNMSHTAERAKEILEGILLRMNLECPVSVMETEEKITLNISGNGGGLLIGKRGQNLDALQYIINKATHKLNGQKMIVVDTESYRQRREDSLVALAAKIGDKVKKTKKAVTLSYLNAHNRRIIHMALQNDSSIITKSRGEGEYRKIVIVPVKKN